MTSVRDVLIAQRTGFCYGVREAIDRAKESAAAGKSTHTLGQTVHNEGVIRDLGSLGVRNVDTLDDVAAGAAVVIRATEGFTPELRGERRRLMPFASCMVATEPLPQSVWDEIGWSGREVLSDGRRLFIYAQRTADDRIALGGRGHPYIFGSRLETDFHDLPVHARLQGVIAKLFPAAADAEITHTWGGVLGIPRDFIASVGLDRRTGIGWAGGYIGDGVAVTNLAGRTLADLITGRDSDLTTLPWVNHRSRRWEPEPLRWIAANGSLRLLRIAEAHEEHGTTSSRAGRIVDWLTGH